MSGSGIKSKGRKHHEYVIFWSQGNTGKYTPYSNGKVHTKELFLKLQTTLVVSTSFTSLILSPSDSPSVAMAIAVANAINE